MHQISFLFLQCFLKRNLFLSLYFLTHNMYFCMSNSKGLDRAPSNFGATTLAFIVKSYLSKLKSSVPLRNPACFVLEGKAIFIIAKTFKVEASVNWQMLFGRIIFTQGCFLFVVEVGKIEVGLINKIIHFADRLLFRFFRIDPCGWLIINIYIRF